MAGKINSLSGHPYYPCMIVDIETRSLVDLGDHGVDRYAADLSTEILIICYAIVEGPQRPAEVKGLVMSWDGLIAYSCGGVSPGDEAELLLWNGPVVAHNWNFEYSLFKANGIGNALRYPAKYVDTMELAYRWGLPGSLEKATEALGVSRKNEKGARLIQKYSVPAKAKSRATAGYESRFENLFAPENAQDLADFVEYCADDVRASADILKSLPPLDERESRISAINRTMNTQGVRVDQEALNLLKGLYDRALSEVESEAEKLMGHTASGTLVASSPLAFRAWLSWKGLALPGVGADVLAKADIPEHLRYPVAMYKAINAKSPKKLQAIIDRQHNGRLYHFLQYYGAHTGRWGARGVQLQNFPRDCVKPDEYVEALLGLWDSVEIMGPDPIDVIELIPEFLRGLLIPDDGKFFGYADYSAIEARVIFWLAGAKKALAAYAEGRDLYVEFASRLPLGHLDPKTQRDIGKRGILSFGFGMGPNAFSVRIEEHIEPLSLDPARVYPEIYRVPELPEIPAFGHAVELALFNRGLQPVGEAGLAILYATEEAARECLAAKGGLDAITVSKIVNRKIDEAISRVPILLAKKMVSVYREQEYPEVPAFWRALEKAWFDCVETGKPRKVGKLHFYRTTRTLRIVLPSGRELSYFNPRRMTYSNPKYGRIDMYGGKIAENVVQATARDIMTEAMIRLDDAGLPLRMTEHDAVIYELANDDEYAVFEREMRRIPQWADGLPLDADVKRLSRGGK